MEQKELDQKILMICEDIEQNLKQKSNTLLRLRQSTKRKCLKMKTLFC